MAQKAQNLDPIVTLSVRVPRSLRDAFRGAVKGDGRDMQWTVQKILEDWLASASDPKEKSKI